MNKELKHHFFIPLNLHISYNINNLFYIKSWIILISSIFLLLHLFLYLIGVYQCDILVKLCSHYQTFFTFSYDYLNYYFEIICYFVFIQFLALKQCLTIEHKYLETFDRLLHKFSWKNMFLLL